MSDGLELNDAWSTCPPRSSGAIRANSLPINQQLRAPSERQPQFLDIKTIEAHCTLRLSKNYNSYEASFGATAEIHPQYTVDEHTTNLRKFVEDQCYLMMNEVFGATEELLSKVQPNQKKV